MLINIIKKVLASFGYEINTLSHSSSPERQAFKAASTNRALFRAKKRGLKIDSVIDIGASNGSWSAICMEHYPNAQYHLVDANKYHHDALKDFSSTHKNAKFVIAAAGSKCGKCYFDDSDPFGGVAGVKSQGNIKVPTKMINVDSLFNKKNIAKNHILKLDTHGFEQSILKGAREVLKHTELVIIESYIYNLGTSESVTFDELCGIMSKYGFRVGDFSEPLWREKDMSLWQLDLFFYKKDNPMFKDNSYK